MRVEMLAGSRDEAVFVTPSQEARGTAIVRALLKRGVATEGLRKYSSTTLGPGRLFLGYGRITESGIDESIEVGREHSARIDRAFLKMADVTMTKFKRLHR